MSSPIGISVTEAIMHSCYALSMVLFLSILVHETAFRPTAGSASGNSSDVQLCIVIIVSFITTTATCSAAPVIRSVERTKWISSLRTALSTTPSCVLSVTAFLLAMFGPLATLTLLPFAPLIHLLRSRFAGPTEEEVEGRISCSFYQYQFFTPSTLSNLRENWEMLGADERTTAGCPMPTAPRVVEEENSQAPIATAIKQSLLLQHKLPRNFPLIVCYVTALFSLGLLLEYGSGAASLADIGRGDDTSNSTWANSSPAPPASSSTSHSSINGDADMNTTMALSQSFDSVHRTLVLLSFCTLLLPLLTIVPCALALCGAQVMLWRYSLVALDILVFLHGSLCVRQGGDSSSGSVEVRWLSSVAAHTRALRALVALPLALGFALRTRRQFRVFEFGASDQVFQVVMSCTIATLVLHCASCSWLVVLCSMMEPYLLQGGYPSPMLDHLITRARSCSFLSRPELSTEQRKNRMQVLSVLCKVHTNDGTQATHPGVLEIPLLSSRRIYSRIDDDNNSLDGGGAEAAGRRREGEGKLLGPPAEELTPQEGGYENDVDDGRTEGGSSSLTASKASTFSEQSPRAEGITMPDCFREDGVFGSGLSPLALLYALLVRLFELEVSAEDLQASRDPPLSLSRCRFFVAAVLIFVTVQLWLIAGPFIGLWGRFDLAMNAAEINTTASSSQFYFASSAFRLGVNVLIVLLMIFFGVVAAVTARRDVAPYLRYLLQFCAIYRLGGTTLVRAAPLREPTSTELRQAITFYYYSPTEQVVGEASC